MALYLLLFPCILKKHLAYSAIYIFIEFRDACGSESFEPHVLWILLIIPLSEMLMVTLATILSIQMDVLFTVQNSGCLIFISLRQIQLKFPQSF